MFHSLNRGLNQLFKRFPGGVAVGNMASQEAVSHATPSRRILSFGAPRATRGGSIVAQSTAVVISKSCAYSFGPRFGFIVAPALGVFT